MDQKADFGGICGGFVARWEPDTSTWRTHQTLLLGGYQKFLGRWPREGGLRNGSCWERVTLAPHISGNVSGSWLATPTEKANQTSPSMTRKHPGCRRWLPTPTTQDAKNDGSPSQQKRDSLNGSLRGPPHPEFLEYLLGMPRSWTDASGSSRVEMRRFREWRLQHLPYFGTDCTRALDSE